MILPSIFWSVNWIACFSSASYFPSLFFWNSQMHSTKLEQGCPILPSDPKVPLWLIPKRDNCLVYLKLVSLEFQGSSPKSHQILVLLAWRKHSYEPEQFPEQSKAVSSGAAHPLGCSVFSTSCRSQKSDSWFWIFNFECINSFLNHVATSATEHLLHSPNPINTFFWRTQNKLLLSFLYSLVYISLIILYFLNSGFCSSLWITFTSIDFNNIYFYRFLEAFAVDCRSLCLYAAAYVEMRT